MEFGRIPAEFWAYVDAQGICVPAPYYVVLYSITCRTYVTPMNTISFSHYLSLVANRD